MNKSQEAGYQDEITGLNFLLLEKQDTINALGAERDKYLAIIKRIAEKLRNQPDSGIAKEILKLT